MLKNISSGDVASILAKLGISLKRRGKEDIFAGEYGGESRVVVVPRNKKSIPKGTLSSIWRQAGINAKTADEIWRRIRR